MSDQHAGLETECEALQSDEITVLESIYPDQITVQPNPLNKPGKLLNVTIPITLAASFQVILSNTASEASSSTILPTLELSHLPAITLRLHLPPTYPLQIAPRAVSVLASLPGAVRQNTWLSRSALTLVQKRVQELWQEDEAVAGEGSGVIWRFWEWVGSGDFLQDLGLVIDGNIHLPVPFGVPPSSFHTLLKTYNATQLHSSFETTAFSCSICLENRKGKTCIRMPYCGCVFCAPCLSSCWSLAIEEGTLDNVSCPSVSCVKTRATREGASDQEEVDPELVQSVVGAELRDRWTALKEKRKAEIDPTYTVCPRPSCQAAVPPPSLPTEADLAAHAAISSRAIRLSDISKSPSKQAEPAETAAPPAAIQSEDRWARYRLCPSCNFSFCLYCSATWHGPHTACAFPQTSALVLEYLSYPEDSEGRRHMEARRGKANLEKMVMKWREDEENRKWLESRTRPCAGCGVRVEKSHGCNHMTCGRCNAHFCYRCGDSISPQDPYAHYRRPGHACYEKLFDEEEIARFNRETAAGVAGMQLDGGDDWREYRGIWAW